MKITRFFAFMLAVTCMATPLTSCSDDDDTTNTPPTPDPIPALEYFTLNSATSSGLLPGISNYEVEGEVLNLDLFQSANSEELLDSPKQAMFVNDKLVVACGGSYSTPKGAIEVLNAETLVRETPRIEFENFLVASFAPIEESKILVVGTNKGGDSGKNVVIVDIETGDVEEILLTDFNIQYAFAAGDKILIYGNIPGGLNMETFTPIPESFHFAIFDKSAISETAMRTVLTGEQSYAASSIIKFVGDDKGNIWIPLANSDGSANISCFNTSTETVTTSCNIPNTSSVEATNFSLTNSNDGDYIYIRVAEAIYDYSISSSAINPDPMVSFGYQAGKLRDLEMTAEGKFLFIDQDGDIKGGQVFEVAKDDTGVWSKSETGTIFEGVAPNDIILK